MKNKSNFYVKATLVAVLCTFFLNNVVLAHSGGTDSKGCHTNKKTGVYHCHKK
jgi:hypothetical protein